MKSNRSKSVTLLVMAIAMAITSGCKCYAQEAIPPQTQPLQQTQQTQDWGFSMSGSVDWGFIPTVTKFPLEFSSNETGCQNGVCNLPPVEVQPSIELQPTSSLPVADLAIPNQPIQLNNGVFAPMFVERTVQPYSLQIVYPNTICAKFQPCVELPAVSPTLFQAGCAKLRCQGNGGQRCFPMR